MPKFVLLWTDLALWAMVAAVVGYGVAVSRDAARRATWRKVFRDPAALASSVLLLACLGVTLLDSVHFRPLLPPPPGVANAAPAYDPRTRSLLDVLLADLVDAREATYSLPLATHSFTKESVEQGGQTLRVAPRLQFGGVHLRDPERDWAGDVTRRALMGAAVGLVAAAVLSALFVSLLAWRRGSGWLAVAREVSRGDGEIPWRAALAMVAALALLAGVAGALSGPYHLLGTDMTGNDVLYQSLKSLRTAFVIGLLSTVATLPLAVVLGIVAGYFKGWVDEAVQYVYTVLSSVPNVLLIAACVLMVQVFLDQHPELFETGAERSDLKLFLLCVVLGLTGWAGLARLVRAETLKLRELDFVQAADAFGVGPARIMARHVFPNVAHLVLIVTVLDFSALILYEAVLTYVGVGVDPAMHSFGGMINLARTEMSRDPLVWWSFASAFGFMVALVLAANLFADGVRDAFDPRSKLFRARRRVTAPRKA